MAFLQPPITGDTQLDSWTLRLTQQINQGLVPGGSVDGGGGGGSTVEGGNTIIYLYQTTPMPTPAPTRPNDVSFNFNNIDSPITVNDTASGWSETLPENDGTVYIWVTFRYVSGETGSIEDLNSWNIPAIISVPGASAFSIEVSYRIPNEDLTTDPTTWDFHPDGRDFIDGVGTEKAIVPNVFLGATVQSFETQRNYNYSWRRNGQPFTLASGGPTNQRVLIVTFEDLLDMTDQFICVIDTSP